MRIKMFFLTTLIFCGLFSAENLSPIRNGTTYRYHVKGFYKSRKFDFHLKFTSENVDGTTYLVSQCEKFDLPEVRFSLPMGKANIDEFYSLITAVSEITGKKEKKIFQIMHGLQKHFLPTLLAPLTGIINENCSQNQEGVTNALIEKYENWEFDAEIDSEEQAWKNVQILISSSGNEPLLLIIMTAESEV